MVVKWTGMQLDIYKIIKDNPGLHTRDIYKMMKRSSHAAVHNVLRTLTSAGYLDKIVLSCGLHQSKHCAHYNIPGIEETINIPRPKVVRI